MDPRPADTPWQRLRYGPLLAAAGRGRFAASAYARLVATVERARDPVRRRVAEERIASWLGVAPAEARRIYWRSLYSEALEEAHAAAHMRRGTSLAAPLSIEGVAPRGGRPRVYATLHFGSPVLAYLGLRARFEPELRVIARELDDDNPMAPSKRAFGRRKVAWVEATAGATFLGTDTVAVLRAREHLLAGHPVYAAVDVPGDVVTRARRTRICGHSVLLASGIFHLAAMTGADFQMVVGLHRGDRVVVLCRPPVEGAGPAALEAAVVAEIDAVVRAWPEEWWFWPFVVP